MTIIVYYINLSTRPDRRAFMENQFLQLGIKAERIEAVLKTEVPEDLVNFHETPRSLWQIAAGDLACGLSHQRSWAKLCESEHSAAIVLEDDAVLTPAILEFLEPGLLQRLGADLVKLETFHTPVKLGSHVERVGETEVRELCSSQMGGAAYLIGRETARRSLASPLRNQMGIDRFLFGRGGMHLLRSRVLQAAPSPCIQLDKLDSSNDIGASTIATTRRTTWQPRDPLAMLGLHLDHTARLAALAARDFAALRRPRAAIPFAGAFETE